MKVVDLDTESKVVCDIATSGKPNHQNMFGLFKKESINSEGRFNLILNHLENNI